MGPLVRSRSKRAAAATTLFLTLGATVPAAQFTVPDPFCLRPDARVLSSNLTSFEGFGTSVARSGETLLVGAPSGPSGTTGTAYVFERDAAGTWVERAELAAAGSHPNGRYGLAVALDGDVAVVGGNDLAYAFERVSGTWSAPIPLVGSDAVGGDLFGSAVAVEGQRILVGAHWDDDNGQQSGTVFVFERLAGVWVEVAKLYPDDAQALQQFGAALALSQDRALIGAWGADGSSLGQGAAYVMKPDRGGRWFQEQKLVSGSPSFITFFGWSVDLAGERAIVGNGRADVQGSAYVFGFDGLAWQLEAALGSGEGISSVAIDGDLALVGEPYDTAAGPRAGSTAAYVRRGAAWALGLVWPGLDLEGSAGTAVAVEDDEVVISVPGLVSTGVVTGAVDVLSVRPYAVPAVTTRNGGSNPYSYVATPAAIGGTLELTVFPAATGHASALVLGYDSPASIRLASGQTLLCLDQGGGELLNTGFRPGPIARFALAVPDDLSLAGLELCTQAVHAFGATPFVLSNAQDLLIGGCL